MNVYFIEDDERKHQLLGEVLAICNSMVEGSVFVDGFAGAGHTAWMDKNALENALRDESGMFLLDIHLVCKSPDLITEHLLSTFDPMRQSISTEFEMLWEKYENDEHRRIGACLLALAKGLKRRKLITSTDDRKPDGDKPARELAKDLFVDEFRSCGFPEPFNEDARDEPARVAKHKKRINELASAIVKEAKRDFYDGAERAWAIVVKQLNHGPWENHPSSSAIRFFSNSPWHTANEWLKGVTDTSSPKAHAAANETVTAAQLMLNSFLLKLDPQGLPVEENKEVIVVLRAAFYDTAKIQHVSVILLSHLLRNLPKMNVCGQIETGSDGHRQFLCLVVPTKEASKVGRLLQAFWSLSTSRCSKTKTQFNACITIQETKIKVQFQANTSDEAAAALAVKKLEGKEGHIGTAAHAIRELRVFSQVAVQNSGCSLEICAEFGLATVE